MRTSYFTIQPDEELKIDEENAIKLIRAASRSHENGIPEWLKNSAGAYVRDRTPLEHRIIVLVFQDPQPKQALPASISCLDFVGMDKEDLNRFRIWADPESGSRGLPNFRYGGHGNGGKSYMTQMFEGGAYLTTVRRGRGNRYGFEPGGIKPGYVVHDQHPWKDYPVPDPLRALQEALEEIHVQYSALPEPARRTFKSSQGFTLVTGLKPRDIAWNIPVPHFIEAIRSRSQALLVLQECTVYVITNSVLDNDGESLDLEPITPIVGYAQPRPIPVPQYLVDPDTDEKVSSTKNGSLPEGELRLMTSRVNMPRSTKLRYRHQMIFCSSEGIVASPPIRNLEITSPYADRIYGECEMEYLSEFATNERLELASSPLKRALEHWIAQQIEELARELESMEKRKAFQEEANRLREINSFLNNVMSELLPSGRQGPAEGRKGNEKGANWQRSTSSSRPVGKVSRIDLDLQDILAGIGVTIRPRMAFYDPKGERVRPVPVMWTSSDSSVAVVDVDGTILTIEPGECFITASTGEVQAEPLHVQVVSVKSIKMEPRRIGLQSGQKQRIRAIAKYDRQYESDEIFLNWASDDTQVALVNSQGIVTAVEAGSTMITAYDESYGPPLKTQVEVTWGQGKKPLRGEGGFPRVLISGVDPDPDTGEPKYFSSEDPPVAQSPADVSRDIFWINTKSPLAQWYLDEKRGYGVDSREWRVYHVERYVDVVVKTCLNEELHKRGSYAPTESLADTFINIWEDLQIKVQRLATGKLGYFIDKGIPRVQKA